VSSTVLTENYKTGDGWNFLRFADGRQLQRVYRMPLEILKSVADVIATQPGNFGYDEGLAKFHLPPTSGKAEINVYAKPFDDLTRASCRLSRRTIQNIPACCRSSR